MAEEDEIDILGDFTLDTYLDKGASDLYGTGSSLVSQNSDILNCDYTIHPQWLLDRPSTNPDNWYDTNLTTNLLEKAPEASGQENDTLGHVSTENCITDESGWTEKEKNLLDSGIEIFGKSNVRLAQFIGSKTASEVKYYLKNFYMENQASYRGCGGSGLVVEDSNLVSDVLNDTQIPASIEEVIATVCTAKPTVPVNRRPRKRSTTSSDNSEGSLSSSKVKYSNENLKEVKTTRKPDKSKSGKSTNKSVKFKFKTHLKMPLKSLNKSLSPKSTIKQKTVKVMNETNRRPEVGKVEITTGKGLAVPICEGEEIIKLKKATEESDEDVEVDIEDDDTPVAIIPSTNQEKPSKEVKIIASTIKDEKIEKQLMNVENNIKQVKENVLNLAELSEDTVKSLTTLDVPKFELKINENVITELEKVIHMDFFEGRPAKTPDRYLRIRNHIIDIWSSQKPVYVSKTASRQGLKNCGDVNCIGRIHYFLEQIGAINFGCPQMSYIRPLSDMIQSQSQVKEKPIKSLVKPAIKSNDLLPRQRIKKKFQNDGEGGCTLTHDEQGQIINRTIVNEEPTAKPKPYIKKPIVRLIYCRPFTVDYPQKYKIHFDLLTLLVMDFHAHTSLSEVMGLIGGHWDAASETLTITHYEPCRNAASSSTHCDMCPISQARASDVIHSKGLDILGWFHSHPTFAPEPSQQDLETQLSVQQWIGHGKPCVGVILSPFSLNGALIASPFRCMMVDKKINFEDQFVPYKFKVDLICRDFNVDSLKSSLQAILLFLDKGQKGLIDFKAPYFQDTSMSYLDKYIYSVRMCLAKCGELNKMTCDEIIDVISNII